jgi:hypothetical protein
MSKGTEPADVNSHADISEAPRIPVLPSVVIDPVRRSGGLLPIETV